ncbi:MAG: hypothetical protein AAF517_05705, partial [Planctomycetota bacterium]
MRHRAIAFVAESLREACDVQPVPPPALTVLRPREQTVDNALVPPRVLPIVVPLEKLSLVFNTQQNTDEIKVDAAK